MTEDQIKANDQVDRGFALAPRHLVDEFFAIGKKCKANHRRFHRLLYWIRMPHKPHRFSDKYTFARNRFNARRAKIYDRKSGKLMEKYNALFQRIIAYGNVANA